MTVFIVSLFLPYTVNFQLPDASRERLTSPPRRRSPREEHGEGIKKALSLLSKTRSPSPAKSPLTPGATTDHERIFTPPIADMLTPQLQPPPQSYPETGTLDPSDPHSPAWGAKGTFTQPKPVAPSPPPLSILKHGNAQDAESATSKEHLTVPAPRHRRKPSSSDGYFALADWTIEPAEQGNGGLRNAVRSAVDAGYVDQRLWVGTLGMATDSLSDLTRSMIAKKLKEEYESETVFVHDGDFDGFYSHFCKTILWPVFHYQIPDNPKSKAYEDHSWVYYVNANEMFAQHVASNWKPGDVIWIHDYHLLLVPAMLRKLLPNAQIGFFLHVAFPSSEVFRCIAVRKELLEGMLGADLIGFQTDEYCHHFLQTCSRLLCVEATNEGIQLEDRFVHVDKFPIGIDSNALDKRRQNPDVAGWIKIIKERYHGKRLIVARDKLDHIRGVRQKLLSFELFLNKYPQWREKVVLIQVASSTAEQSELDATISDIAMRVNSTFSTLEHQPLVFLKQDLLFPQYLALITVADVFLVTSLREGMNLTSHEFIHCQDGKYSDERHGPLILSEFTGSASVFDSHALLVNPWDYTQCADSIHTALEMSPEERENDWNRLHNAVTLHTTTNWVKLFLESLSSVCAEKSLREATVVPRLSVEELSEKYQKSNCRLLLLDYEGTLASWGSPRSIILTTPQRAIDSLTTLTEDPKNIVYVMSARMPEEMDRLFRRVPNLGLIAENGCFVRHRSAAEWLEMCDDEETRNWKEGLTDMLNYFRERTEGSWIEERHCSIVFHHERAEDQQTAERQAAECATHINDTCAEQHVHAVAIDGAVTVEPIDRNKATAANLVLDHIRSKGVVNGNQTNGSVSNNGNSNGSEDSKAKPDFLFVIGDDREDEIVFRWANKLSQSKVIENVMTTTLGSRNTDAMSMLTHGVTGVLSCLQKLASLS